jgi:hypothetical protein
MEHQCDQPSWAAAVEILSDFVIGSLARLEKGSIDFLHERTDDPGMIETIAGLKAKDLGPAAMTIDKVRYEGRLFGANSVYLFVGKNADGSSRHFGFANEELILDAGSYPWRVELKPRIGKWETAVLTDLSWGARKET